MNRLADKKTRLILPAVVAIAIFTTIPASAQDATRNPPPATQSQAGNPETAPKDLQGPQFGAFGLQTQDYWVAATEFAPRDGILWQYLGFLYFGTSTTSQYEAQVQLPAGAHINFLECFFFDNNALDANVGFWKQGYNYATNVPFVTNITTVGSSGTSGYQIPFQPLNYTIKYRDGDERNIFTLIANMPASTGVRLRGCRFFWNRSVSPAPGTATFADVPVGSSFHPFVEALAASGITGGCGGGNYCPNATLTRGQMAIFLSAALGLHWPY